MRAWVPATRAKTTRTNCASCAPSPSGWAILLYKESLDTESGGKAERPQFQKLFTDAHQRRFDVVLFWALDRFNREGVIETLNQLQRLTHAGVQFKSYSARYLDSTGMFKEAIISILATIAKQERVRLGERTKAGLAKGKQLAGPAGSRP